MVAIMYSSGLRIGEVCHLRYDDISRCSMRVHIRHSKNRSERFAPLSMFALDILTQYWFEYGKPRGWLFPKQTDPSRPIDTFFLSRHIIRCIYSITVVIIFSVCVFLPQGCLNGRYILHVEQE